MDSLSSGCTCLQAANLRTRCAQAENDALRSKEHAENVVLEAETQMRTLVGKTLKEFDAAVSQREMEISESAQVRSD